jgi:hypothetical protein
MVIFVFHKIKSYYADVLECVVYMLRKDFPAEKGVEALLRRGFCYETMSEQRRLRAVQLFLRENPPIFIFFFPALLPPPLQSGYFIKQ